MTHKCDTNAWDKSKAEWGGCCFICIFFVWGMIY